MGTDQPNVACHALRPQAGPWTTIPGKRHWYRFATKLLLAAQIGRVGRSPAEKGVKNGMPGRHRPRLYENVFPRRVLRLPKLVIVGRLRRDAALRSLPPARKPGQKRSRGRPRKYGKKSHQPCKAGGVTDGRSETIESYAVWLVRHEDVQDGPVDLSTSRRARFAWYWSKRITVGSRSSAPTPRRTSRTFWRRSRTAPRSNKTSGDVKEVLGDRANNKCGTSGRTVAVEDFNLWMHTVVELMVLELAHPS